MTTDLVLTNAIKCELIKASATDLDVVNSARISFDEEHPALEFGDDKLIHYLLRERHGSPFEHTYFKFRLEAPIFEVREHHRHRVGHSYNEMSGRYTELEPKFYLPENARVRVGKPGHYVYKERPVDASESVSLRENATAVYHHAWGAYQRMIEDGVALEQARMVLPVGIFTKFIWSCNARSLMHFLGLRNASTAQREIQIVAKQAEEALANFMPITYEAFIANGRQAP